MENKAELRGFKAVFTGVSLLYMVLGLGNVLQGPRPILEPFGVPEATLSSPFFGDFYHWLFVHMITIGLLIGLLGRLVESPRHQRTAARVICLLELHYTYLDTRTSVLGNRLYNHPKSLVLVAIDVAVLLAFLAVAVQKLPAPPTAPTADAS